jgi:hypothetical protein
VVQAVFILDLMEILLLIILPIIFMEMDQRLGLEEELEEIEEVKDRPCNTTELETIRKVLSESCVAVWCVNDTSASLQVV